MKLLFDETYGSTRNTWHQTGASNLEQLETLVDEIIKYCQDQDQNQLAIHTFYTEIVGEDAIGDRVRTAIMVRNSQTHYDLNFNTSDLLFTTEIETILRIKIKLNSTLNN